MSNTLNTAGLKASLQAIASQVDTVKVRQGDDGWHLYGGSNYSVANVHITKDAFTEYDQEDDFVADVKDLLEPLAKAGETVTIDTSTGKLVISSGRFKYTRKLLADIEVFPRMPKAQLQTEVILPVEALTDIFSTVPSKDAKNMTMRLTLTSEDLTLNVYERGNEYGRVDMTITKGDCTLVSGEANSIFGYSMVEDILKTVPKGTDIDLLFDTGYPLMVKYTVGHADIVFALAPQLEDDDL